VNLLPIAGAKVDAGLGLTTTTDLNGAYTLSLSPGTYTVTASAQGYSSETASGLELVSGTVVQNFALQPLQVTLTGQVSDAVNLLPIAGAEVDAGLGLTTTTDLSGAYTLSLSPGTYTVTASAQGYSSEMASGLELVSGTVVQNFALQPLLCPTPTIHTVDSTIEDLSVSFSATVSATPPLSYLWDFGDGVTSTLVAPTHTYALYGTYTVTLALTDRCGNTSWVGEILLSSPEWKTYLPLLFKGP
jgi:PKD repeat protein